MFSKNTSTVFLRIPCAFEHFLKQSRLDAVGEKNLQFTYRVQLTQEAVAARVTFGLALIVDDHMLGQQAVLDGIPADRGLALGRPGSGTLADLRSIGG